MAANLSELRRDIGLIGGIQTALLYSHETRVLWGSKGGRPRARTLTEYLPSREQITNGKNEKKEVGLPRSYHELKKVAKALRMEILRRSPSSF